MKVIICGSPQWTFGVAVEQTIVELRRESMKTGKKLLIIHGNENGAESIAAGLCHRYSIDVIIHEAVKRLGQNAIYRRNEIMLNYHKPDLVVCFAPVISECNVVRDMLKRAERKGIKTRAVDRKSLDSE